MVLIIFPLDVNSQLPGISVVIVTYNRAKQLQTALESVFQQKNVNLEIVVIDNGSTDETTKIVAVFQKKYPHLIYQKLERNYGPCYARNLGFMLANFSLIFSLDDDARLEDEFALFNGHQIITAHKKLGILNLRILEKSRKNFFQNLSEDFYYTLDFYEGACFLKKELTQKIEFKEAFLQGAEGFDFAVKTLQNGFYLGITKKINLIHNPLFRVNKIKRDFYNSFINTAGVYLKYFIWYEALLLNLGTFLTLLLKTNLNPKKLFWLFRASMQIFWLTLKNSWKFRKYTMHNSQLKALILYLKRKPRLSIPPKIQYSTLQYCWDYFG